MAWGDPGVSEMVQIQESAVQMPSASGGSFTRILQPAGLLKRLRMLATAVGTVAGFAVAPSKSVYGPLGAYLSRVRIAANGQIPLVDLSGLGAFVYNEIQNRDGSPWTRPTAVAEVNVTEALKLARYDTIGGNGVVQANFPFEFLFALPINIANQVTELGLWLLQNQAISVGIELVFNQLYQAAANRNALWSGGTITSLTPDLSLSRVEIERELYDIPEKPANYPNLAWTHQVAEFDNPWTGSVATFNIQRAGLLLRAVTINLDSNGDPVEYSDISSQSWIYGANENPIRRPGWSMTQEFLQDYSRMPPKGVTLLDFYKWGGEGLKLVKNTEEISNLRLETRFSTTTTGTQKVILDRLVPVISKSGTR